MNKVYAFCRILAIVLASLALVNIIAGVTHAAELDKVRNTYSYDINDISNNHEKWEADIDAFEKACDSNTTIVVLRPIVTVLTNLKPICLYVGMLLFFVLLKRRMVKGSRLKPAIILGLVTSLFCLFTIFIVDRFIPWHFWLEVFMMKNYFLFVKVFYILGIVLMLVTFLLLLRFLPHKKWFTAGLALVIVIFLFGIYKTMEREGIIPWIAAISYSSESILLLSFAVFYFSFSKLKYYKYGNTN